jgi:hypothetical protein
MGGQGTAAAAVAAALAVPPPMVMMGNMGPPVGDHELPFSPHYVKCTFKDVMLRMCIGLVVQLASGVNNQGMLKSKMMPDGRTYCLDMLIPDAVTNPEKFLLFIRAFMLEQWRRFKLVPDFPVVEDIVFSQFMTLEGSYFLYLEFMAQEKSSYMHGDGTVAGGVMDLNKLTTPKY